MDDPYPVRSPDERRARSAGRAVDEVVLDWNGTVVADRPRAVEATNAVLREHGLAPITDAGFGRLFTLPLRSFFSSLSVPAAAFTDAEAAWNRYSTACETALSRGALELLQACQQRQVPAGILTAAGPGLVSADAARLGIRSQLSWISGPGHDKAADLLARTASAGHVAHVGDTAHDVSCSRRAGALAVAFTSGYHDAARLREAGPDLIINDLRQLIPSLRASQVTSEPIASSVSGSTG